MAALACVVAVVAAPPQKKPKKEEETQVLQVPRDLPATVTGDPRRLTFHVTPLSAKGLLSQQIRDALKALDRDTGSDTVLKIRAFTAGSGDVRRVRDLVSEIFTERRQPLPVLSLIQSGGLPLEGSQVVLESISSTKKEVNPNGLVFLSPRTAVGGAPAEPVAPLTERSLAALREELRASGSEAADMLRVTCFLSSLDNLAASRKLVEAEYPKAALNFVQTQRAPFEAMASCEGVARLRSRTAARLQVKNVDGAATESGVSQLALVTAPVLVLTGTQISFGYEERNSRLAFDRLAKGLEQAGTSVRNVAYVHYYPLSPGIAKQVVKIRSEVFGAHSPAGFLLQFEGLPSMDAGFAVDVIAVKD